MRNVILGAIALLPHPKERYMRSGRIMFGGRITIDDSWTLTFEDACTPPLSEYIVINEGDRSWLSILASKLINTGSTSLGQMKALEYYYRAWSLNPAERFPTLFMALDALFSERGKANQSIVEGARDIMGPTYSSSRLNLLLGLRAATIHGGSPEIYDCSKYFTYYEKYLEDPIYDLEVITARCLQAVIFSDALSSRPHTHADIIREITGLGP